ncbi:cupin domain-containing protein [Sphingosinicellaceae bacterium]|nr:cupin domain-containing protein [Sphingosinicellaceae bacterium]
MSGYYRRNAPSRLAGAVATFAPGARTPWKVNPLGQTLIVTDGMGWAQCGGEAIVEIRAGDVIWCPPGERHWEGATPDEAMTYLAIHEGTVEFTGKVTDEEYRKGPSITSFRS